MGGTYKQIAEDIVANNPNLSHGGDYKGFVEDIMKNNPNLKFDITPEQSQVTPVATNKEKPLGFLEALKIGTPKLPSGMAGIVTGLVKHPINAIENVGKLGLGAVEAAIQESGKNKGKPYTPSNPEGITMFKDAVKNFGTSFLIGTDAWNKQYSENPEQTLLNVGSVLAPAAKGLGLAKTGSAIEAITNPVIGTAKVASAVGGKLISPVLKGMGNVRSNIDFRTRLADKVLEPIINKSKVFEEEANAIMEKTGKKTVDLSDAINQTRTAIKNEATTGDVSVQNVVNRSPTLAKYIDNPSIDVSAIPYKQAQLIKNELSGVLKGKLGKPGSFKYSDMPTYQVRSVIDEGIMDSIPELAPVKAKYGQTIKDFKVIKNLADTAKNIPELKKFGDTGLSDQMVQVTLNRYLGANNPIIKELGGYRKTWFIMDKLLKIPFTEASLAKAPLIGERGMLGKTTGGFQKMISDLNSGLVNTGMNNTGKILPLVNENSKGH